jgi:hypothetical protein
LHFDGSYPGGLLYRTNTSRLRAWPTPEMAVRGNWQDFLIALPVAFFSGLGVALSSLGDQTSSLVSVAIFVPLLPPAVKSGIFVGRFYCLLRKGSFGGWGWGDGASSYGIAETESPTLYGDDVSEVRSDFRTAGLTSLSPTLANIFLSMIASMIMFQMKEVSSCADVILESVLAIA